jgi:hypothetical protein
MRIFIKPGGAEVEVNDTSMAKAKELGWIEKVAEKKSPKKAFKPKAED